MRGGLIILSIVALTTACAGRPPQVTTAALARQPTDAPERYLIVAVRNDPTTFLAQAGGTPRGYDAVSAYGPTAAAIATLRAVETDYRLREVNAWPIESLRIHCAVLEIATDADRGSVLSSLSGDPRVRLAQPLQFFSTRTAAYNDPYVDLQRGFQQMDVVEAHPWALGRGVKVAIVDTGADLQHPDLRGRIAAAENFVDADTRQFERDRHGTEMAGVIAAVANNREGIVGIAPEARLYLYKACWQVVADADAARCNSFTLARALAAAFDARAQVINLSLAGPDDPLLHDLIREGLRRGILFVGAGEPAGAGGLLHQPGVIEVGSTEAYDPSGDELGAPGHEILTLLPGGHYDFATGDSIATAEVTGVVALLLERDAGLTAARAYRILRDTSTAAAGGGGQVDACAAITALAGQGSCPRAPADASASARTEGIKAAR